MIFAKMSRIRFGRTTINLIGILLDFHVRQSFPTMIEVNFIPNLINEFFRTPFVNDSYLMSFLVFESNHPCMWPSKLEVISSSFCFLCPRSKIYGNFIKLSLEYTHAVSCLLGSPTLYIKSHWRKMYFGGRIYRSTLPIMKRRHFQYREPYIVAQLE